MGENWTRWKDEVEILVIVDECIVVCLMGKEKLYRYEIVMEIYTEYHEEI